MNKSCKHAGYGFVLFLVVTLSTSCENDTDFAEAETHWMSALGTVELTTSTKAQRIGQGDCRTGTVAQVHVDLCNYKDAVSADTAREVGLAKIAGHTGAAVVRKRTLLVVSDPDEVDVHDKIINQLTTSFRNPPAPSAGLSGQ